MDEIARKPTIRLGNTDLVVTDPNQVIPVACELITDLRIIDGTLFLSLASHISDGTGPAEARVVARLRIPMGVVAAMQNGISAQLASIEEAKKAAN